MSDYSIEKYQVDISTLANKIKAANVDYDHCIGIARGGLIPGVHLSHALGIPFSTLQWSTRDYIGRDLQHILLMADKKRVLLVDDICDSGLTLQEITEYPFFKAKIDTAVLIYNISQSFTPTYFSQTIDRRVDPEFIDFWWERA